MKVIAIGNGYSKSSGKNEKHSNIKAREQQKGSLRLRMKRLKTMKKEGNTTRHDLKKVEKEIKHWKNKMDNVGETHHRR